MNETDYELAEKIMGWRWILSEYPAWGDFDGSRDRFLAPPDFKLGLTESLWDGDLTVPIDYESYDDVFEPSTSIADAMKAIDMATEKFGWRFELKWDKVRGNKGWSLYSFSPRYAGLRGKPDFAELPATICEHLLLMIKHNKKEVESITEGNQSVKDQVLPPMSAGEDVV